MNLDKKKSTKNDTIPVIEHIYYNFDLSLMLKGNPGLGDWLLLVIFNSQILFETKWQDQVDLSQIISIPFNLIDSQPLILLLRVAPSGKGTARDQDPLQHIENKAGGTVDLLPLVLGESKINVKVPLISVLPGTKFNCYVGVYVKQIEEININKETIPLTLTMISAHCLPSLKDGTACIGAMELGNIHIPNIVNFGMSLSDSTATNVIWASASNAGRAANTSFNVPFEDKFIPTDLEPKVTKNCNSVYWNAMSRILVDHTSLRDRLKSHFVVDIAAVPKVGKFEIQSRYTAFVDAGVLLEARQFGVTVCAQLIPFNEANLPENMGTILEIPSNTKLTARDPYMDMDEYGHFPYIVMRFDLCEPLTPEIRTASYYEVIGFSPPDGLLSSIFELEYAEISHENKKIDAKCIRREAGALAVHEELSRLVPVSAIQTKQSIKHTAANRLLLRLRLMLKQFPVDKTDNWQDIVTAQHRASLRSVLASFAPQVRVPKLADVRGRLAGDVRIATEIIENNLQIDPDHPKVLFNKALRCLEDINDTEARIYLLRSLKSQPRNRYLLWTLGGINFNKSDASVTTNAAFYIALNKDVSDGITGAIGWAALHTLNHFCQNNYAAFVAAKKMRKCFELERTWKQFIERWINISGEEEIYWDPSTVSSNDPLLIASAFFLCLRCFDFSEKVLQCYENGCSTRGSRFGFALVITSDVYYIRIASLILRKRVKDALMLTEVGIKKFGPVANLSQIRATCLVLLEGWNSHCTLALSEADKVGAKPCSFLLCKAALGTLNTEPEVALQYAARAYTNSPSAFIALIIARIYGKIGDEQLAERWAVVAVNEEPLLADGWAFLAILAMRERNIIKARSMLRTSQQTGPLSSDIKMDLKKIMKVIGIEELPHLMAKDICFCEYY